MKNYKRTMPTMADRAKMAIIWLAIGLLAMWVMSCEEDQPKPMSGNWTFSAFEVSPNYEASRIIFLEMRLSGYPYKAEVDNLLINGVSVPVESIELSGTDPNTITSLKLTGSEFSIEFKECAFYDLHNLIRVMEAEYVLPDGTERIEQNTILIPK
jgi:hypothetical protein